MSLKDKMKTYNFWISLASAIVLIVRILGDKFNFIVDTSLIMDITTGLCSIFVILGILSVPKSNKNDNKNNSEDSMNITSTDLTPTITEDVTNINEEGTTPELPTTNSEPETATEDNHETIEKPIETQENPVVEKIEHFLESDNVLVDNINSEVSTNITNMPNIQDIIADLKESISKASSIIEEFNKNTDC